MRSFTAGLGTEFSTKWSLHIPPHLKDIAALPCEIVMFQKWNKFNNTVLKKRETNNLPERKLVLLYLTSRQPYVNAHYDAFWKSSDFYLKPCRVPSVAATVKILDLPRFRRPLKRRQTTVVKLHTNAIYCSELFTRFVNRSGPCPYTEDVSHRMTSRSVCVSHAD